MIPDRDRLFPTKELAQAPQTPNAPGVRLVGTTPGATVAGPAGLSTLAVGETIASVGVAAVDLNEKTSAKSDKNDLIKIPTYSLTSAAKVLNPSRQPDQFFAAVWSLPNPISFGSIVGTPSNTPNQMRRLLPSFANSVPHPGLIELIVYSRRNSISYRFPINSAMRGPKLCESHRLLKKALFPLSWAMTKPNPRSELLAALRAT